MQQRFYQIVFKFKETILNRENEYEFASTYIFSNEETAKEKGTVFSKTFANCVGFYVRELEVTE